MEFSSDDMFVMPGGLYTEGHEYTSISWVYNVSCVNVAHWIFISRQVSNIRRTFVGNLVVDHSDVVAAPPVGAGSTTSLFST